MTGKHRWTKWAAVSLIMLVTFAFAFFTFSAYAKPSGGGQKKSNNRYGFGDRIGRLLWGDRKGRLLWGPKQPT